MLSAWAVAEPVRPWVLGVWASGQGGVVTAEWHCGPCLPPPRISWGLARVCHSHHWWVHTDPREGRGPGGLEEEDLSQKAALFLGS